jgi:hypothetical protein
LTASNEPDFLRENTVPEVEDNVTADGPEPEWKEGSYSGYDCQYREIKLEAGETVVTKRGNVYARKGDYVVSGLDEAPAGYHSQSIPRVIRSEDNNLTLDRGSKAKAPESFTVDSGVDSPPSTTTSTKGRR